MIEKPTNCCHPNCFKCPYDDCKWDSITEAEIAEAMEIDELIKREKNYNYARYKRYYESDSYKKKQERYMNSEKGKEVRRRNSKKAYDKLMAERGESYLKRKASKDKYNKRKREENATIKEI